jgi:hypothetical protein
MWNIVIFRFGIEKGALIIEAFFSLKTILREAAFLANERVSFLRAPH